MSVARAAPSGISKVYHDGIFQRTPSNHGLTNFDHETRAAPSGISKGCGTSHTNQATTG